MIPLQNVPLYAPISHPARYWTAQRNTTEWSVFMTELVLSGNALTKLMLEALAPNLKGAHVGQSACQPSHDSIRLTPRF